MSSPARERHRIPRTLWCALKVMVCAGAAVLFLVAFVSYSIETKFHDFDDAEAVTLDRMRSVADALCAYQREHGALPKPGIPPVEIFGPTLATGHGQATAPDPGYQLEDGYGRRMVLEAIDGGLAIVAQPPSRQTLRVFAEPRCHLEQ